MGNSAEEEGSLVEEVTVTPTMDQENTLALSRGRVSEDKQVGDAQPPQLTHREPPPWMREDPLLSRILKNSRCRTLGQLDASVSSEECHHLTIDTLTSSRPFS